MDNNNKAANQNPAVTGTSLDEDALARYLNGLIATLLAKKSLKGLTGGGSTGGPSTIELPVADSVGGDTNQTEESGPVDTPESRDALHAGRERPSGRASMREQLLELFGSPERLGIPTTSAALSRISASLAEPGTPELGPSAFLQRFLPTTPAPMEFTPSGISQVDSCLSGGFKAGLHLISGEAGIGKTALLESVGWEAISSRLPVVYYALKEGASDARTRLTATLAGIIGEPFVAVQKTHGRASTSNGLDGPALIDRIFQTSVLPWLTLVDSICLQGDRVSTFIEDLDQKIAETRMKHGSMPVVLIDDLDSLAPGHDATAAGNTLSRLNAALTTREMTGLLTFTTAGASPGAPDGIPARSGVPAQTVVALSPAPASPPGPFRYVDLTISTKAGASSALPLLLDIRSGIFASRAQTED